MFNLNDLFGEDSRWMMKSLDDDYTVQGQFTTNDIRETLGANWNLVRTHGRAYPVIQWADETPHTMTFSVMFWAEGSSGFLESFNSIRGGFARHDGTVLAVDNDDSDQYHDIKKNIDQIKGLPLLVKSLGRARIWRMVLGNSVNFTCVCKGVSEISHELFRKDEGDFRKFTARITLMRYEPHGQSAAEAPAESLVQGFSRGETYEAMARNVYGSPTLGDALRRRNPGNLSPTEDTFIHVPPAESLRRERSHKPQCHIFNQDSKTNSTRVSHYDKRSKPRYKSRFTPEWSDS